MHARKAMARRRKHRKLARSSDEYSLDRRIVSNHQRSLLQTPRAQTPQSISPDLYHQPHQANNHSPPNHLHNPR